MLFTFDVFQLRAFKESLGPLKEVAYWAPEKFHVRRKNRNFAQSSGLHDDPLGLSVERSDVKISDAELREFFGEDKTSEIGSENFDPGELKRISDQPLPTTLTSLTKSIVFILKKRLSCCS